MAWSAGMDQRRFPRIRRNCTVSLRQSPTRSTISTSTENVGLGGICVLLDQGLDIFAPVEVELNLGDGQPPLSCKGMVAWVVRRRELNQPVQFDTGIEFVGLPTDAESRIQQSIQPKPSR